MTNTKRYIVEEWRLSAYEVTAESKEEAKVKAAEEEYEEILVRQSLEEIIVRGNDDW